MSCCLATKAAGQATTETPIEEVLVSVKLSRTAYDHAQKLVRDGQVVHDDRDAWSEHQPSADQENEFLAEHGFSEYAKWYLGEDDEQNDETKGHYKFPYGDFQRVHRCGVLSAESRAGQNDYTDIRDAAAHLLRMLDEQK
jgi:O-glycosyl hydrolase